jgi:GGDEF domain-containing protein
MPAASKKNVIFVIVSAPSGAIKFIADARHIRECMTKYRRTLFLLSIALVIFFNLERLAFDNLAVGISSSVYVVGTLAVLSMLALPRIRKMSSLAAVVFWAVFYLLVRIATQSVTHHPVFEGLYLYSTILEILILDILALIAQQAGLELDDFEDAVQHITMDDICHDVRQLDETMGDIQLELLRSRRHNYPLTVIMMEPDPGSVHVALNHSILDIQKLLIRRYVLTSLTRITSNLIRRTDLLVDQAADQRIIVISPDTNLASANELAKRIAGALSQKTDVKINYGLAAFPEEDLTIDELLSHAERRLREKSRLAKTSETAGA